MRRTLMIALALGVLIVTGCGGDDAKPAAAPGSPENPLQATVTEDQAAEPGARSNEGQPDAGGAKGEQPGYQSLVEDQGSKPASRFTPCNLVTPERARAIVGAPLQQPVEAPQGPTCIYRTRGGDGFVTLAVQQARFDQLRRQIKGAESVRVADREGLCGEFGQPVLYVPLTGGRVLSVGASCDVATQFAREAVQRLGA